MICPKCKHEGTQEEFSKRASKVRALLHRVDCSGEPWTEEYNTDFVENIDEANDFVDSVVRVRNVIYKNEIPVRIVYVQFEGIVDFKLEGNDVSVAG